MGSYTAELHDIGKLVDWDHSGLAGIRPGAPRHAFHNFDFSQLGVTPPSSPSWWGQWSDSLRDLQATGGLPSGITDEGKGCVLLTNIADVLAASISRTWGKRGNVEEGVHLLWNPNFYQKAKQDGRTWAAVQNPDALKEMFRFIDSCRSAEEFFDRFRDHLLLTPEDKSVPLNFVPLSTHLDLTGKVFRVLRFHSKPVQKNGKSYVSFDGQDISQVQEAAGSRWEEAHKGKWIFRLIKCTVHFPQAMARLQDLNVLELRGQKIQDVVNGQFVAGDPERQPYAVLFHTGDSMCLFVPREKHLPLRNVLRPLWQSGFWIECEELEAEVNLLTSTGDRTRKQLQQKYASDASFGGRYLKLRHIGMWPNLDPVIVPPLCDLCQQRQGREYVKDQVREWLCEVCRAIREMGEPASIYARWEEEGVSAAWLKVSLDQELLLSCLQRLFESYVDTGPGMNRLTASAKGALKQGFRPLAAQMEFVREYEQFLQEFKNSLDHLTGRCGALLLKSGETLLLPIPGYLELAIVRLDSTETLQVILDNFVQHLKSRFPECIGDCPIRLSVSIGNPKYPYHEHWRFFSEPQQPSVALCIRQPGVRQLSLTVVQYLALRGKVSGERLSHFLHRLASVEAEAGEMTALFQALEERSCFPQLHDLMMFDQLNLRQVLDFYRLIGPKMQQAKVLHA